MVGYETVTDTFFVCCLSTFATWFKLSTIIQDVVLEACTHGVQGVISLATGAIS